MNKENCALKLVDEIILYYDARLKKHQISMNYIYMYMEVGLTKRHSLVPGLQNDNGHAAVHKYSCLCVML